MNRMLLAGAVLCLYVGSAGAQNKWIGVASTDDSTWDVQSGSLEESKTRGGIDMAVVVGRISTKSTKKITLYKWYVSLADCDRGMGKLVSLDIEGKYQFDNDFVFDSGNVASAVASAICSGHAYNVKAKENKGL